jgi:hypothetical protein
MDASFRHLSRLLLASRGAGSIMDSSAAKWGSGMSLIVNDGAGALDPAHPSQNKFVFYADAFGPLAEDLEQQLGPSRRERDIAEFVDDQQLVAGELTLKAR